MNAPRAPGPYGLFLSLQALGLMGHIELYNGEPASETIVLLGFTLSWRQHVFVLARFCKDALWGGRWLWLEWWNGHRLCLPKPQRGQVGERA